VAGPERALTVVNRDGPASFEHDTQHTQLGIPVFAHLVAGRPRQESGIQVVTRHPPQGTRPCRAQQIHGRMPVRRLARDPESVTSVKLREAVTVLRYMHLLAMGFFVGGQIFLAAVVVPTLRTEGERDELRRMARRFGVGTLVAVAVLIGTGIPMASHFNQWGNTTLHVKLGAVALVAALVIWHIRHPQLHVLDGAIFLGSLAIVWLGVSLAH